MGKSFSQGEYKTHLLQLKDSLYGVSYAQGNEENIYCYLVLDPHKSDLFKQAIERGESFNIQEYAMILNPAQREFPRELKEQLRIKYNAIL